MVQLPPFEFTYGKYNMLNLSWEVIKSTKSYVNFLLSKNIIGYCKSEECEIRSRVDEMAIMFEEEDGWQGWSHIPIDIWEKFLTASGE